MQPCLYGASSALPVDKANREDTNANKMLMPIIMQLPLPFAMRRKMFKFMSVASLWYGPYSELKIFAAKLGEPFGMIFHYAENSAQWPPQIAKLQYGLKILFM